MNAILWLFDTLIGILIWFFIASVILNWLLIFNIVNRHTPAVQIISQAIHSFTEPVLRPIRRILPPFGNLDLAPLVAIIGLMFLQRFILEMAGYMIR